MKKDQKDYTILVIEDNPGDFTLIEDYLQELITAPRIIHAETFAEAKSLVSDRKTDYDVIILDLSLPDKSGEELIKEINSLSPGCPVIVLTGYGDIDFSIKSLSLGVADYLLKEDINASSLYKSIIYNIERKKANIALQESEKRYSNLFHLSPQPMWLYDPETFFFVQVNKAAIEAYGYSEKEFLKMTVLDIRPEEEPLSVKKIIVTEAEQNQNIFKGRFTHRRKSKELIEVEIYSNPITLNDKTYRSVIAIDVTEKIQFDYKITRAIIKTQEDERYEIGSELHDNVCQILASAQMTLGMMKESVDPSRIGIFDQSRSYITLAIEEIRNLSHRLAPAFFEDTTLEDAFQSLLRTFNIGDKYKLVLYFDKAIKKATIDRELQLNLFRILQEQLKNILKYAGATTIRVDVVKHNNKLRMQIADNGVGFNSKTVKRGIGLANMKRRAELFLGKLEIVSSPGHGCEITAEVPLQENTTSLQSQIILSA